MLLLLLCTKLYCCKRIDLSGNRLTEEKLAAVFQEEYSIGEETFKDILESVQKELSKVFTLKQ